MQGARVERGCQILDNSVVPPGRLIPAGQQWGGNPIEFCRVLTNEEMIENYSKSYTQGATEYESSLWPHEYVNGDNADGESVEEYAKRNYFKQLPFKE